MELKIGQKIDINELKRYLWERSKKSNSASRIVLKNLEELSQNISEEKAKEWNIHLGVKERIFTLRKFSSKKESVVVEELSDGTFLEWTSYVGWFKVINV